MSLDVSWITPALAVGGCFDEAHAEALAGEHRISAVVDLREEACDDAALLVRHGIELLHLPTPDTCAATPDKLDAGVAFVTRHLDGGRRALIHCQHGIGRSALLALCVLVAHGHAPLAALELAKARRGKVSPSPAQYEGWAVWLRARGVQPPTFDEFAEIAYRHLRTT